MKKLSGYEGMVTRQLFGLYKNIQEKTLGCIIYTREPTFLKNLMIGGMKIYV